MTRKKLYIARCGNDYKIGVATNPDDRVKQLQTGNPNPIELLGKWDSENAESIEKRLHALFYIERGIGEWFQFKDRTALFIDYLFNHMNLDMATEWMEKAHPTTFTILALIRDDVREIEDE